MCCNNPNRALSRLPPAVLSQKPERERGCRTLLLKRKRLDPPYGQVPLHPPLRSGFCHDSAVTYAQRSFMRNRGPSPEIISTTIMPVVTAAESKQYWQK